MLTRHRFQQILVALSGALYIFTGVALLFASQWFYEAIAHFPPFNRHFMSDIGAFTFPLGLGLLLAARAPRSQRLFIGVAALGSFIHLGNHLYDDWLGGAWELGHFLMETLPLALSALALGWVAVSSTD